MFVKQIFCYYCDAIQIVYWARLNVADDMCARLSLIPPRLNILCSVKQARQLSHWSEGHALFSVRIKYNLLNTDLNTFLYQVQNLHQVQVFVCMSMGHVAWILARVVIVRANANAVMSVRLSVRHIGLSTRDPHVNGSRYWNTFSTTQ